MTEPTNPASDRLPPKPLPFRQRRILGVLMEKARTTPDVYPLSLNGLVSGCNQKSNRHPTMELTSEQVEDELEKMRAAGVVAEVQGGSRVAKYRHFGYDYMQVKGAEAAVMTELLLRGEQTVGELRTRASRFEPIADLPTLQRILDSLMERGLVVPLTPGGRGQLITHNLYLPEELSRLKQLTGNAAATSASPTTQPQPAHHESTQSPLPSFQPSNTTAARNTEPVAPAPWAEELEFLREEVSDLRQLVEKISDRLDRLEG
ncbi:MAG: DUF480 domain-containing protein [Planctomycetales bacterium]|nr:DUF480 domain-containing protein [Planctomycetales bacterium]